MAASKTTKKRKRKPAAKQQPVGNRFQTEILILVMFAACLILMISAFGMGGIVGNAISSICFGIMGLCAYLFPIVLFGGVTFLIVNNKNRLAYKKIFAGIVFFSSPISRPFSTASTFLFFCADFYSCLQKDIHRVRPLRIIMRSVQNTTLVAECWEVLSAFQQHLHLAQLGV